MEKDLQVVGFRIGNETYGVRIASVREIVRVPEITAVPSAPDLSEGVINLRGKIIPVMDLRKRFGETEIHTDKKNRILVVELDNKLIGLIVNAASEVLKIPPSEIEAPGSVFAEGATGYVTGVGKLKGRLIILLDISKLLRRPEFKRLEEVAEPVATARYCLFGLQLKSPDRGSASGNHNGNDYCPGPTHRSRAEAPPDSGLSG